MSHFQAEPDPVLLPYVHSYWGLTRDLSRVGGFTVTPDRFLELIFFLDPPFVEEPAGGRQQLPTCCLIPLLSQPLRLTAGGVVRCAAVRLHAWAAGVVFPPPPRPPAQPWGDAPPAFARHAHLVAAALRRDSWAEVTAIFNVTLRRVLAGRQAPLAALAAARSFVALPNETEPAASVPEVAARQGRSRRQVERQVRALTCHSPKRLSSLARFQFVRDTLWARPDAELAALAFEAGYADQAHMTRHFRRYAAQTPGEFIREAAGLKAFVRAQDDE